MDEYSRIARWDALVQGFKYFGGTAENLIQRRGPLGLGLFPIDQSQPVELRVPDYLLVATDNLKILDGIVVLKDTSRYPKGFGEWYEYFQAEYSWGAEGRQSIKSFEEGLKSLPDSLLKKLENLGLLNIQQRFAGINEQQVLFQRFIATRQIKRNGNNVLMPMIELVNHSPIRSSWTMDTESIMIQGRYNGEILVRYSVSDPLRRYIQYGFNCKEPLGFSLRFKLIHNNREIVVDGGINYKPSSKFSISKNKNSLILHKPLLSSKNSPRMPRKLFRKALESQENINPDDLFDQIHYKNRILMINIIKELDRLNNAKTIQLKSAFLDQIEILSERL